MILWRERLGVLIAGLTMVLLLALASGASGAQRNATAASLRIEQGPSQVRGYWTPARMRAAVPAELRLGTTGRLRYDGAHRRTGAPVRIAPERTAVDMSADNLAFPQRVHGKAFFTIEGGDSPGDFACSATVVAANSHTLAWTAGHCVNDAESGGGFATNWTFVPGYRDGEQPFGSWPAVKLFTTSGWSEQANIRVDLGAASLARDPNGRGIEDVIGARGIGFNRDREQSYRAFGYPAQPTLLHPEFNGERLYACDSLLTDSDDPPGSGPQTLEIDCDMSGGSSGGGWVGDGLVSSVVSYGFTTDFFHLYGPYQGSIAQELYERAAGPRIVCARRVVTNLGSPGPDPFTGTLAGDAFRLAAGADAVTGGDGNDRICAGNGADQLRGDAGADELRGGGGRDLLVGGPGRDLCDGGPGRDRARSCEVRKRIP